MDIAKAHRRNNSEGRSALEEKFALLNIAVSDPDEAARIAAAHTLCSMGSIASFIRNDVMGELEYASHETDGPKFALLHGLIESIHDEDALFDIVMHGRLDEIPDGVDDGVDDEADNSEYRRLPDGNKPRMEEGWKMRLRATQKIASEHLLLEIIACHKSMTREVVKAALAGCGKPVMEEIMNSEALGIDWSIYLALELMDTEYLTRAALNPYLPDETRLYVTGILAQNPFFSSLPLDFLKIPPKSKDDLNSFGRYRLVKEIQDDETRRRFLEQIARDSRYELNLRIVAGDEARELGGTPCPEELCEEALRNGTAMDLAKACGTFHNGHRWRYKGIWTEYIYNGKAVRREGYRCVLCGAAEGYRDPRPFPFSGWKRGLAYGTAAQVRAEGETHDDNALAALLEHESELTEIQKIIAKVSSPETLFSIAHGSACAATREEALLELYERDRTCIDRITDEGLLYILAVHSKNIEDVRSIMARLDKRGQLQDIRRHLDNLILKGWRTTGWEAYIRQIFDFWGDDTASRPRANPPWVTELGAKSTARAAAVDKVEGDENLASLLGQETDLFAVRKAVAKISDSETLFTIAHANPHAATRREAVLEFYERDSQSLARIHNEELLCALGLHVSDPTDLRFIIARIESPHCLCRIGTQIVERGCSKFQDISLAAFSRVSDQKMLSASYSWMARQMEFWDTRFEPLFTGLLNMITERNALGRLMQDKKIGSEFQMKLAARFEGYKTAGTIS